MVSLSTNTTYHGNFDFIRSDGKVEQEYRSVGCSQEVRFVGDPKWRNISLIRVYIPYDWVDHRFNNELFLKFWCEEISNWFTKVDYGGIGLMHNDNRQTVDKQLEYTKHLNKGDYLYSKDCHIFNISIDRSRVAYNTLCYASFILIRYLGCTAFHEIIENFINCKRYQKDIMNIDPIPTINRDMDFLLLQISHMACDFRKHFGSTYCLMDFGLLDYTSKCPKLSSLDDVIKRIVLGKGINAAMRSENVSSLKVGELGLIFRTSGVAGALKVIYDKTK